MVDSLEQLDIVDTVLPPGSREQMRVAIELDSSLDNRVVGHLGVWRSPIRTAPQARALAEAITKRPGFALVGMMGYEAQIAGLGNAPIGRPDRAAIIKMLQRGSAKELHERRAGVVAAVREVAELEFVNGGGTGSLESTHEDGSVTEIAAGSGLMGPRLFDNYAHFQPAPAAAFALSVVRKPTPAVATLLGGGWLASGPGAPDRMPQLVWPAGLKFVPREGAGEVQSPVRGSEAERLAIGDRVWLRHLKAGELSEHVNAFALVDDGTIVDTVPSYRGEGKAFL
jgi:D-serine deaminase-like pyridoxal phosphate-dependent protein